DLVTGVQTCALPIFLGGAFNASTIPLRPFIEDYEEQLKEAENKYVREEHRHRTLFASIDISIQLLSDSTRTLLSKLVIFHASFLPETAATILIPENDNTLQALIFDQLKTLSQLGLLDREVTTLHDCSIVLYILLPMVLSYT